jgi:regulator of replication initiation timing
MTTLGDFRKRVDNIYDRMTNLQSQITNDLDNNNILETQKADMKDLQNQAAAYDREFEEAKAKQDAMGGKGRAQTLQEFVLLFFYVCYLILTVSFTIYMYTTSSSADTAKMFFGMLFILLVISGILIVYS